TMSEHDRFVAAGQSVTAVPGTSSHTVSTVMEPQGPLDPQIYWRRRMAAGGGALVLLIVLIIIIAVSCGSGSGSDSDDPEDTAALPVTTSKTAPATRARKNATPDPNE